MNRTPAVQQECWNRIKDHFTDWYHELDFYGTMIALSQYVAHLNLTDVPVWSFILGSSSSGKSIPLKAVSYLPNTYLLDVSNENTFLSAKNNAEGILETFKPRGDGTDRKDGVILISDFSTILNLHHETRLEIQSQLRKIYDGSLTKVTGVGTVKWEGKVTLIAACTPTIERYWSLGHDLGERFLYYRVPINENMSKMKDMAERTIKHVKFEANKERDFKNFITNFVGLKKDGKFEEFSNVSPNSFDWRESGLLSLATAVAKLRRNVIRDSYSKNRDILDIDPSESPTRLMKALVQVSIGNAMLMREPTIKNYNVTIAKLLATSSIPKNRALTLQALWSAPNKSRTTMDLSNITQIPYTTMQRVIEDMEALQALVCTRSGQVAINRLHPSMEELLTEARIMRVI